MARLSTYTKDLNLTGKDMLAGSNYITTVNGIDQFETNNFTLEKITEYINGQIITDPSALSLKVNGGLVYETVNDTNFLAVNLSHTNITGQLANSDLANSSITINGTEVSLGGTITIGEVTEVIAGTYLNGGGTEGSVTVNHDTTTRTDTASTASPSYGDNFTVIDTLTTNATGHVTAANVKTITLPASDDTTYTVEAVASTNDSIIRLVGSDSTTDDVKLIAGSNITLSTSEASDTITINSQAFGTVYTVADETAHLALNTFSGDLVIRTDESKTYIDNGTGASPNVMSNYTELQFSGINNIALTAGNGITLSRTSITNTDNDLTITNALATSTTQGGIELFSDTEQTVAANTVTAATSRTYGIQLNSDDQAVVNVPWTDTTYTLPVATNSALGGIKIGYTDNNKNYALELDDDDEAYVNVPWTDTVYTLPLAADGTRGGVQIGYSENGKNYPVELDSEKMFVNVPWTDNNDNTQNTYDISIPASTTKLRLSGTISGASDTTDDIEFVGSGATTITRTDENTFTISSTDTDNNDNTTYGISCVNGDNTDEEKIRLTGSDSTTDDVVLEAGTGLSIARDGDKITYTNTVTNTTNWNWQVDTNSATNVSAGETVTLNSGDAIAISTTGRNATINHENTSSQASVNNSGRTYIQDITLDTYGHVTGLTSATETVVDTNTQRTDEEIRDVAAAQWIDGTNTTVVVSDANDTIKINATNTNDIDYINAASFNTSDGVLTLSGVGNAGATVDLDGRYLTSYSETDTLATVTSRGSSTTTDTTFNSHLTIAGASHWLYIVPNTANTNPTHVHGMAMGWNYSGGSRESNIIFAAGSDANASQEADAQIRFSYKAVNGTISTVAKLWSGGNLNIGGYLTVQDGGNTITNAKVGQWDTAYGWGNHASAGYSTFSGSYNDLTNKPTIPTNYLRDDADDTSSGSLTVVSYKFNGNASNPTNTTATIYDQASVGLTASAHNFSIRNYNGSSMVESARFTTGSLTVIGDVVAYGSPSDISLKENIKPIKNALDKVERLQGVTFDWKESDSILNIKEDIGFIAQDVQKVLPELVRKNDNGKLSLRHQGIISVLAEAIKELSDRVKALEDGITK
jgi:hypothetical protein